MARVEPSATELTDPFWDATREQRYLVQWCAPCAVPIFYPREVCPTCLSAAALEWRESSGQGTVYALSMQHRPGNPFMADRVPYVVALIELDAGGSGETIRVMSNVVDCDPLTVSVGDPVTVAWGAAERRPQSRRLRALSLWRTYLRLSGRYVLQTCG